MGNNGQKKISSSSSCSSLKLLWFIVPLILVSVLVAILGPKTPWLWSLNNSVSSSSSKIGNYEDMYIEKIDDLSKEEGEKEILVNHDHNLDSLDNSLLDDVQFASPPLFLDPMEKQRPINESINNDLDEFLANGTTLQIDHNPVNESNTRLNKARVQREYTNLERLETGLQKARLAIKEAKHEDQINDPDYIPQGPIYRNAKSFHKSYLEMEKQFRVFVYEEGEPPIFHNGPCKSIYSMEGNFIHALEIDNNFRTKDPEKAHMFFLPFSVSMMVQFVYIRNSHDFSPIKKTVVDYINVIADKYPYWNRSLAADHFMLACHDWGPETSLSTPNLWKNSIRALCNANTSEGFNPSKDVSFPEINLQTGGTTGLLGGPSPSRRPILAFFAGGLHGPIRPVLLEHWEGKDENILVQKYLPKGISYYDMMRKTKYCLCPSGYEVASPRVVEALYTGCVPVLISDHYVPPFSDVLNWKSFSVEVSVEDVPNLKKILMSISSSQYIRMQKRGVQVRRHFEVNSPTKRYDVYHMILHSIWLRRLNLRVED